MLGVAICSVGAAAGIFITEEVYNNKLNNALSEDFRHVASVDVDSYSEFRTLTNVAGETVLQTEIVGKDLSVWRLSWDATGYDLDLNKFGADKDIANVIKNEEPVATEYGPEM